MLGSKKNYLFLLHKAKDTVQNHEQIQEIHYKFILGKTYKIKVQFQCYDLNSKMFFSNPY